MKIEQRVIEGVSVWSREGDLAPPAAPLRRLPLPDDPASMRVVPLDGAQGRDGKRRRPDAAGRRHGLVAGTVALCWCSGCGRLLGFKLWPPSGHWLVHTHGLCPACFERLIGDELTDPDPVALRVE